MDEFFRVLGYLWILGTVIYFTWRLIQMMLPNPHRPALPFDPSTVQPGDTVVCTGIEPLAESLGRGLWLTAGTLRGDRFELVELPAPDGVDYDRILGIRFPPDKQIYGLRLRPVRDHIKGEE